MSVFKSLVNSYTDPDSEQNPFVGGLSYPDAHGFPFLEAPWILIRTDSYYRAASWGSRSAHIPIMGCLWHGFGSARIPIMGGVKDLDPHGFLL